MSDSHDIIVPTASLSASELVAMMAQRRVYRMKDIRIYNVMSHLEILIFRWCRLKVV